MKKSVAIVMGGYSSEFDISLKSGNIVYRNLDRNLYDGYRVVISDQAWYVIDEKENQFSINRADFSFKKDGRTYFFDLVFNAIHGIPGENGQLLAYFETLGIPHSSAPFYQMALTFNKKDCLAVLSKYGIKTAPSLFLNQNDTIDFEKIKTDFDLPVIVKPNQAGSSYGISKVNNWSELEKAIQYAFQEDENILVEKFIAGREFSIGVISNSAGPQVLPVTEIISENDFFDYEAKYEGKSQEITPANIDSALNNQLQNLALEVYKRLDMNGFSRSEFIVDDQGDAYFLEMNTVPGLTEQSILPQQAAAAGIDLKELFNLALAQN
jgi:D-alanine-D-alanine ligase